MMSVWTELRESWELWHFKCCRMPRNCMQQTYNCKIKSTHFFLLSRKKFVLFLMGLQSRVWHVAAKQRITHSGSAPARSRDAQTSRGLFLCVCHRDVSISHWLLAPGETGAPLFLCFSSIHMGRLIREKKKRGVGTDIAMETPLYPCCTQILPALLPSSLCALDSVCPHPQKIENPWMSGPLHWDPPYSSSPSM